MNIQPSTVSYSRDVFLKNVLTHVMQSVQPLKFENG